MRIGYTERLQRSTRVRLRRLRRDVSAQKPRPGTPRPPRTPLGDAPVQMALRQRNGEGRPVVPGELTGHASASTLIRSRKFRIHYAANLMAATPRAGPVGSRRIPQPSRGSRCRDAPGHALFAAPAPDNGGTPSSHCASARISTHLQRLAESGARRRSSRLRRPLPIRIYNLGVSMSGSITGSGLDGPAGTAIIPA